MKALEFYSKAQLDPIFRGQQLEAARYDKKMTLWFMIALSAGWLSYVAYCDIAQGRWPGNGLALILLTLCLSRFDQARARLGALEAMPSKA